MAVDSEVTCRARILDAAERAFADGGFSGASMRDIVDQAEVNLATVYYYFGSKRGLMDAVLKRRFDPLRQEHLDLLRQLEDNARGRPLLVEQILEAMLLPPLRLLTSSPVKRQAVTRLLGRIVTEPDAETQKMLRTQRADVRQAFLKAFQASLPGATSVDLQWRMEFVWGALGFILCNQRTIKSRTNGACNAADGSKVLSEMIKFFSPGFRAIRPSRRPRRKPSAAPGTSSS
jgi:AcrR family transcriptional regulator